jgi:hypothetical protein
VAIDRVTLGALRAALAADVGRVEQAKRLLEAARAEDGEDPRAVQAALLAEGHLDLARGRASPQGRARGIEMATARLEQAAAAQVEGVALQVARRLLSRAIELTVL